MDIIYGPGLTGTGSIQSRDRNCQREKTAVALGFFDGVHKGHRALLDELKKISVSTGLRSVVYTFVNHPLTVLGADVRLLGHNSLRAEYIAESGIDQLRFVWFDRQLSRTAPEDFAKEILAGELNAAYVLTGENYTFGSKGSGNAAMLAEFGRRYGFEAMAVPPVKIEIDGQRKTVSSSLLRKLAAEGRMAEYEAAAGHRFRIDGTVTQGRRVGRSMNFPTANIVPDRRFALPSPGVYATVARTSIDPEKSYPGITNVGNNPTFNGVAGRVSIETNLIGFRGDLYGRELSVEFIEKTRGEIRFSSKRELAAQIASDAADRIKMFETRGV